MRTSAATRFTLVLLATLAALGGVQLVSMAAQRSAERVADSQVQLTRNVAQIRYYDELLTMSARLAAVTGDNSYVKRYHQAVPKLARVIAEALSVAPDTPADDAVRATSRANQALIALEKESFRLLAGGDRAGAYATVTSSEYGSLKAEYKKGMDVTVDRLQLAVDRRRTQAAHRQRVSLGVGFGAAVLLALLWAATFRGLRRSQHARRRVEQQLQVQAHSDPLTRLANRRLFRERLTMALATPGSGELAVLFADLDHFKTVNDTCGHAVGDLLLVEVAERVSDLLHGHTGAVVARLGGDEFAVLLPSTDELAAAPVAERLVAALARPYAAAPQIPVSASVGLAVSAAAERDPGALLRGADLAMYHAKAGGRGRWIRYAEHMHSDLLARVELESQLREGMHRGELVLHYQPIQHLRTGRRCGVEALVRWQHPHRGLLPPAAFVALAESSDLIIPLGRIVLEQACRQLAEWRVQLGDVAPTEVAVNVSPRELNQNGYAAQVLAVLHLTGLPASSLVLEVTESTIMIETSDVIEVLTDLRAAGVRIAIDDFGTGHSSLARLHELPIDVIKIDRSFVLAATPDDATPGDTTVLELLVALAGRLQLDLVAEGIETPRQYEAVRAAGCTYGQGYLLGRPQPPETLSDSSWNWNFDGDPGVYSSRVQLITGSR